MANITLFLDTGFTDDNFPDSPTLLGQGIQSDAQDLVQIFGLNSLRVFCNENTACRCDYIGIGSDTDTVYYRVSGYRMLDAGTAELAISLDMLLTIGGISAFASDGYVQFLDGITERAHIAKSADNVGTMPIEPDELLSCSQPLKIVQTKTCRPYSRSSTSDTTIIESAINVGKMGYNALNGIAGSAYTYVDTQYAVGTAEYTVPMPIYITDTERTRWRLIGMTDTIPTPGTAYFDLSNVNVQKGLEIVQGLGLTSAIVSSYVIPKDFDWQMNTDSYGRIQTIVAYAGGVGDLSVDTPHDYNYIYDTSVSNKRVLYGEHNRYTIQAIATGEKTEFLPEELVHTGDDYPQPYCIVDPRSSGKPYYRFQFFRGSDANSPGTIEGRTSFFRGAVKGMTWADAPQVYTSKNGNLIDNLTYSMDKDIANYEYEADRAKFSNKLKDVFGMAKGYLNADFSGSATYGGASRDIYAPEFWAYNQERLKHAGEELQRDRDYAISQKIVAPTICFPLNETLRDLNGNGCIAYRVRPTDYDLHRQDKLLTMYGYKQTKALEVSDLSNRSKFNYVKAHGVRIAVRPNTALFSNSQISDALSAQFENGVRIWHTQPDYTAYTDGSNI